MKIEPCPYCTKADFETRRSRGGHVSKCPARNGSPPPPKVTKDPDPLAAFKVEGFEVVYATFDGTHDAALTEFQKQERSRAEDGGDVRKPLLLHASFPDCEMVFSRRPREREKRLDGWHGTANMLALPFSYMAHYDSPMDRLNVYADGAEWIGDLETMIIEAGDFTGLGAKWWAKAFDMDPLYVLG